MEAWWGSERIKRNSAYISQIVAFFFFFLNHWSRKKGIHILEEFKMIGVVNEDFKKFNIC